MVKEKRIVFGSSDIMNIRIICGGCKSAVVLSVNSAAQRPNKCPFCPQVWSVGQMALDILLSSLRTMSENQSPIDVRFEIDGNS